MRQFPNRCKGEEVTNQTLFLGLDKVWTRFGQDLDKIRKLLINMELRLTVNIRK